MVAAMKPIEVGCMAVVLPADCTNKVGLTGCSVACTELVLVEPMRVWAIEGERPSELMRITKTSRVLIMERFLMRIDGFEPERDVENENAPVGVNAGNAW